MKMDDSTRFDGTSMSNEGLTALAELLRREYRDWLAIELTVTLPSGIRDRIDLPRPVPQRADAPHPCIANVIATLEDVGHRLSRSELQAELARRGFHCSERTLARYLPEAAASGLVTHDPRTGYGLPAWPE